MQAEKIQKNPASKFLIMHPFHTAYEQIIKPKFRLYPEAQKTSQVIHNLMVSRGWKVFGGDQDYTLHLINRQAGQINKEVVLNKLSEMFRNDSYENLAIFLIAHGHKYFNEQYKNLYHWIEIETGPNQSQFIELRQILNLWKPTTFKHLFIALYACNAQKIKNIMMQYNTYSTISIITSYDKNNKVNIYPHGNCTITKHLFGLSLNNPQFKQIVAQKSKIIGHGHHQRWVMILSESYQNWSKAKFIKDIIYHTDQKNPNKDTSKYFGGVRPYKGSKYEFLKHGKGFMNSTRYFFQGKFYFGRFRQGRLYQRNEKTLYGTRFDKYQIHGKGCTIFEDQESTKNDRIIIGNFPLGSKHFYLIEKFEVSGNQKFIHLIVKNMKYQITLVSNYENGEVQSFQNYILKVNKNVPQVNGITPEQYKKTKKLQKKKQKINQTEVQISFKKIQVTSAMPNVSLNIKSKTGCKIYQNENYSKILTTHHLSGIFDRYCYIEKNLQPSSIVTKTTRIFTLKIKVLEGSLNDRTEYYYSVEFNTGKNVVVQ